MNGKFTYRQAIYSNMYMYDRIFKQYLNKYFKKSKNLITRINNYLLYVIKI